MEERQDLISRQAAKSKEVYSIERHEYVIPVAEIDWLPSAQPEIKPIEYRDCANAMQRMWMDNVVTDGEYNRTMDRLNAHWRKKNEQTN